MTDHSEDRVTIWLSTDLKDRVDAELGYGDNRSAWLREAAQLRLALESECELRGVDLPDDPDDRRDELTRLLRAGIDATDE